MIRSVRRKSDLFSHRLQNDYSIGNISSISSEQGIVPTRVLYMSTFPGHARIVYASQHAQSKAWWWLSACSVLPCGCIEECTPNQRQGQRPRNLLATMHGCRFAICFTALGENIFQSRPQRFPIYEHHVLLDVGLAFFASRARMASQKHLSHTHLLRLIFPSL